MKKLGLFITTAFGLVLTMALLWVLGSPSSPAVAATGTQPSQDIQAGPVTPIPHPILSDIRIRRAIAYCTDKDALVAAAYPGLTPAERQALIADTFIHPSSWTYSAPATTYPYNPATGASLMEAAGWTLPPGGQIRMKDGKELALTVRTTKAGLRVAFLTVFESQMHACGIHVIRDHQDNLAWLQFRDFGAAEYAWVHDLADPGGSGLYSCGAIPSPENGWAGQNTIGWCNPAASAAIIQASDTTLSLATRHAAYATFIDLFAEDIPVLPLFFRDGSPEVWEHIDFNLETYSQAEDVSPGSPATLSYVDFAGNQGTIAVPAGAATQTVGLSYTPLAFSAHPPLTGTVSINNFRLEATLQGVPQEGFAFSQPITVTLGYTHSLPIRIVDENSLGLYTWDSGNNVWQPAAETCPPPQRYSLLDTAQKVYQVRVCHLSEFSLGGTPNWMVFLPLASR